MYEAITDDEAKILAEAANHHFFVDLVSDLSDGYFIYLKHIMIKKVDDRLGCADVVLMLR